MRDWAQSATEADAMVTEVLQPRHYRLFPDAEVIDVIRKQLTAEEFAGYCKGNMLKYRLRAGKKGCADRDISKADIYEDWLFEGEEIDEH